MPVAAIVSAGAAIGGSILSAKAQKKAANRAAQAQEQSSAQQIALQRDIYGQNYATLNPFAQRGNVAGDAINALLGLPSTQAGQPAGVPAQGGASIQPVGLGRYGNFTNDAVFEGGAMGDGGLVRPAVQTGIQPVGQQPGTTPQTAQSAFQNYLNSTGYQFRVGEGQRALNSGFAGKGLLDSGAARKGLAQYGQNIASDEFGRYLGYLGNQQGVGLSGASAIAGVGQNYANAANAANQNAATAAGNAALIKGQTNANLYGNIASGIGSLFGSSYGR